MEVEYQFTCNLTRFSFVHHVMNGKTTKKSIEDLITFFFLGIISCMGEISKAKVPHNDRKLTKDWGREIKLGSGVFSIYRFNRREAITGRHPGFIEYAKSTTKFCTKSSYEGNYNSVGFAGYGEYIYPHG